MNQHLQFLRIEFERKKYLGYSDLALSFTFSLFLHIAVVLFLVLGHNHLQSEHQVQTIDTRIVKLTQRDVPLEPTPSQAKPVAAKPEKPLPESVLKTQPAPRIESRPSEMLSVSEPIVTPAPSVTPVPIDNPPPIAVPGNVFPVIEALRISGDESSSERKEGDSGDLQKKKIDRHDKPFPEKKVVGPELIASQQPGIGAEDARTIKIQDDIVRFTEENFARVVANWKRPKQYAHKISVVIQVILNNQGRIIRSTIKKSSGDAALDLSALEAVNRTGFMILPDNPDIPVALFRRLNLEFDSNM